jgi:hypothetical protein
VGENARIGPVHIRPAMGFSIAGSSISLSHSQCTTARPHWTVRSNHVRGVSKIALAGVHVPHGLPVLEVTGAKYSNQIFRTEILVDF